MTGEMKLTLERTENNLAILRHETLGEFHFPKDHLPEGCMAGDTITLKISTSKDTEDEKYANMRRLLEELIN